MIILANDRSSEVADLPGGSDELWIRSDQLTEATGWELKPEGPCLGEICVPLLTEEKSEWIEDRDDGQWLNMSSLADKVGQKHACGDGVWSLGSVPEVRHSTLESAIAPDFELTDRNGDTFRLSDMRGKKVLLMTWASW
jgi:hypothetical protein